MKKGSCLCGAVAFEIHGAMAPALACHCGQCRKSTGHYWVSSQINADDLHFTQQDGLRWYQSSPEAERGFCAVCGSSLFWRMPSEGKISIAGGSVETPTDITIKEHIFVADKGDYYQIEPSAKQKPQY